MTNQSQYTVGAAGSIWVFGTQDGQSQAVLNSNPQVTVRLLPSGTPVSIPLADDGVAPDGQANDGLYAGSYQFTAPGTYLVAGSVTLPTPTGSVTRTAQQQVTVIDAPVTLNGATIQSTGSGCAQSLGVQLDLTIIAAGTYVFHGELAGPDGTTVGFAQTFTLAAGAQSVLVPVDMDDVKQKLGYVSPLTVKSVMGIYVDSDSSDPVVEQYDIGTYTGAACRNPIDVDSANLSVTETMQGGQIAALNFSFPVNVATTGSYDIMFNIIGAKGELIDQINLAETLTAGDNTITYTEPGEKFANIDGPYQISGLVVIGSGVATTLINFTPTTAYSGLRFVGARLAPTASPIPVNTPWMLGLLAVLMAAAGLGAGRVWRRK